MSGNGEWYARESKVTWTRSSEIHFAAFWIGHTTAHIDIGRHVDIWVACSPTTSLTGVGHVKP